ncbi:hypothetical protein RYX36_026853, partial [Vicia faba]
EQEHNSLPSMNKKRPAIILHHRKTNPHFSSIVPRNKPTLMNPYANNIEEFRFVLPLSQSYLLVLVVVEVLVMVMVLTLCFFLYGYGLRFIDEAVR